MILRVWQGGILLALVALIGLAGSGCGPREKHDHGTGSGATPIAKMPHEHGEWWCNEHGVPEKECTRCDEEAKAAAKKKGDWCDKHGRADSQCFICHPELEAKFAARYEAKLGKKPPKPEKD